MRKPFALSAALVLVAAAVAAGLLLVRPAWQARQDARWERAGEQAVSRIALPGPYRVAPTTGGLPVCPAGPGHRCFLGPGTPEEQLDDLRTALAPLTTGEVASTCWPTDLPGRPRSCHLTVPVAGSRLLVDLFARPADQDLPMAQWTYDGAYVAVQVGQR